MTREFIDKFTTEEIDLNDLQIIQIETDLIPGIDEKVNALLEPAAEVDRDICDAVIQVNATLARIHIVGTAATSCGCGVTTGIGVTAIFTGTARNYRRVTIERQDSESKDHSGVNPYSVGIFGSSSDLTTGIGGATAINTADLGKGVKTNVVELTGVGTTVFQPIINPAGIATCPGETCAGFAASMTALVNQLNTDLQNLTDRLGVDINSIKDELKVQYTRRHGFIFGIAETKKRTGVLKRVRNFSTDPERKRFFPSASA